MDPTRKQTKTNQIHRVISAKSYQSDRQQTSWIRLRSEILSGVKLSQTGVDWNPLHLCGFSPHLVGSTQLPVFVKMFSFCVT